QDPERPDQGRYPADGRGGARGRRPARDGRARLSRVLRIVDPRGDARGRPVAARARARPGRPGALPLVHHTVTDSPPYRSSEVWDPYGPEPRKNGGAYGRRRLGLADVSGVVEDAATPVGRRPHADAVGRGVDATR